MNTTLVVCVAAILSALSLSAHAQEEENMNAEPTVLDEPGESATSSAPTEISDEEDDNSSADWRERKSYVVSAIGAFGLGLSAGAELATNLGPSLQVGLRALNGSRDLKNDVDKNKYVLTNLDKADLSMLQVVAHARLFLGNSFNVALGTGMRWVRYSIKVSAKQTSDTVSHSARVNSFVLGGSLGNQWVFDNGMVLGCDWISFYQPLASSVSTTTTATGSTSGELKKLSDDLSDTGKRIGKMGAPFVLGMQIGLLF